MRCKHSVKGIKHWVADKDAKVLLGDFNTYEEARAAVTRMILLDKENDMFVRGFYEIVEGALHTLENTGYKALEDIHTCSDILYN